jgi:hypothetical protein
VTTFEANISRIQSAKICRLRKLVPKQPQFFSPDYFTACEKLSLAIPLRKFNRERVYRRDIHGLPQSLQAD